MKYTLYTIMADGFPVKVYVNQANTQAYVFPLFGKYFGLLSDENVLDFATNFIINKNHNNVISFAAYQSQDEDTAVIYMDKVA